MREGTCAYLYSRGTCGSTAPEMGSCLEPLRSIDACVAGTEGLVKERCGGTR